MWFKNAGKPKPTRACYLLLDRTGSMQREWFQTLESVNGYVHKLEDDVHVFFAVFDSNGYDVVRDIPAGEWRNVGNDEVYPRGMTNLFDSTAKIADEMVARSVDKSVLVIMTDGEENSSTEYKDNESINKKLETLKDKNWPVVFLGAEFQQVQSYAGATFKSLAATRILNTSGAMRGATMDSLAVKSASYYATNCMASMDFSDDEKLVAESK
jgi:uncharacterized protein YegL